jgi:hypothetical protein
MYNWVFVTYKCQEQEKIRRHIRDLFRVNMYQGMAPTHPRVDWK